MMAEKPLMLKEHLVLDSNSESIRWAPLKRAAGTTLRCLLDTELRGGGEIGSSTQVRSHSKSALTRLSNVIKAVNVLKIFTAGSGNPANSLLHRSFSKKLRRGFWKRSHDDKERDLRSLNEEAVETSSLFPPSPVVSSCRSSFDGGDSTCSEFLLFSTVSSPQKETSVGVGVGVGETFHRASTDSREPKENGGKAMDCPLEEEEEQYSPVSVMEFPYKDDDDDEVVEQPSTPSPCSRQSLTSIETTNKPLGQFESCGELDPVDLDHQFACTETHLESIFNVAYEDEERRRKAFSLLHQVAGCEPLRANEDKLLFDFVFEGLSLSGHYRRWRSENAGEDELIQVATEWISGEVCAVEDVDNVVVGEMERSGEWRRFEEEDTVEFDMSRCLMTWLIEELVGELSLAA